MIGFNRRFDANFSRVKRAIVEGEIGGVNMVRITSRDPSAPPIEYIKVWYPTLITCQWQP